jgi:hypothetical protein
MNTNRHKYRLDFIRKLAPHLTSKVYIVLFVINVFFVCRFLRSISYREFTRLVYGILGNRRIPLPSCAYTMIRKTFPVEKEEDITGLIDSE